MLDVKSFYHIELYDTWNDKKMDGVITGIVAPSNLNSIDPTFNLRTEYFVNYGLGISDYYRYISDSTIIYIVNPITSFDPKEYDESANYFIPDSLVDYTKTYKYSEARRYNFTINTGVKKFDTVIDENDFFNESISKIIETIGDIDLFIADTVSADISYVDVLTTEGSLSSIENERLRLVENKNNAIKENAINREEQIDRLYKSIDEQRKSEKEYREAKYNIETQLSLINEMRVENENNRAILNEVRQIMIEMISRIQSGELLPENFPSFEELYNQVEEDLFGDKG